MFEKPVLPMESRYLIDKFFNEKKNSELHLTCRKCKHYIGKLHELDDDCVCNNCEETSNVTNPSSDNVIAILDPSETIIHLLETHANYYDTVISKNFEEDNGIITDVYDGKKYREYVNTLPREERYSYVTGVINTDGAQPFEKSPRSLWPLYIMLNELPIKDRFNSIIPCALWFNRRKPNFSVFLDLFVDLIKKMNKEPLECMINGQKRSIKLHILMSSVDSVARAYMQGTTQFNGKWGCNWCLHPTEYVINATKYPIDKKKPSPKKRTKEETIKNMYSLNSKQKKIYGTKAVSPLIFLGKSFNIVDGFTTEYMHTILLGVVKQITNKLLKPADEKHYEILLREMKLPHQVCRLTRPLEDNAYWNAKVWENWALFMSLPLFSTRLPSKYVKYWSMLVESLHILLKSVISISELSRVEKLLKKFVELTQQYFGKSAMTYNIHQLSHVVDNVQNWGPLWSHSAFSFESGNHRLMQAIHCANGAILQILRFININNSVSLIEQRLFSDESEIAKTFCCNTLSTQVQKCLKIKNRTYFGKGKNVDNHLRIQLRLSTESFYYERLVYNGCLYVSFLKNNPRSDNSVAQLNDGSFVQIEHFIVDSQLQKEIIQCKELPISPENSFYNATFIKTVIKTLENPVNDSTLFIETSEIKSVCVHYTVDGTEIVCCLPNLLYY